MILLLTNFECFILLSIRTAYFLFTLYQLTYTVTDLKLNFMGFIKKCPLYLAYNQSSLKLKFMTLPLTTKKTVSMLLYRFSLCTTFKQIC